MQDNIYILSANMNRQPDALTSLLETTDADILLIQEPSWGRLVPKKSDTDPDGIEVKGTCSHPKWHTILPITEEGDPPPPRSNFSSFQSHKLPDLFYHT